MNWMIRLSARSTPGTPRTRRTAVSGKVWAKSTLGVSFEVTHTSALQFSMVTVALLSRPMKRPTCTSTRVTAKATPATVMKKRRRSWNRFFRARETMAQPFLGSARKPRIPFSTTSSTRPGEAGPLGQCSDCMVMSSATAPWMLAQNT